jgi:hypothetical protein
VPSTLARPRALAPEECFLQCPQDDQTQSYFCSLLISNTKANKPVVTVGASRKWKISPGLGPSIASTSNPRVENRSLSQRRPSQSWKQFQVPVPSPTVSTNAPQSVGRKTSLKSGKFGGNPHLRAQLLSQFIEQPVQILVALAELFNLEDRVQDRSMVLTPKLASNLR